MWSFDTDAFDKTNAFDVDAFSLGYEVLAKVYALEIDVYPATVNASTLVDAATDALAITTYPASTTVFEKSFDSTSFDEPNAFDQGAFSIGAQVAAPINATTDALVLTEHQSTVLLDVYVDTTAPDALVVATYQASIGFVIPTNVSFDNGSFDEPTAFSINAFEIEVGTPTVFATTDALTLTTYTAFVEKDLEVVTNVDALTLTTYAAQLNEDTDVDTNVDGLVLTEYQANIAVAGVIMAGSTTLTINENKASVVVGVQGASDALILTEYQSTITLDVDVQTNVDGLVLAESAATIETSPDLNLAVGVDTLSLATYAATIWKDTALDVGVDALALTTYQADIGLDTRILAGFDALVINTLPVATPVFTPNVRAVPVAMVLTEYRAGILKPSGHGGMSHYDRKTREDAARKKTEELIAAKKAELDALFDDVVETSEVLAKEIVEPVPSGLFPVIPLKPLFTLSPYNMEQERQSRKQIKAAIQKAEAARERRKAIKARAVATAVAKHNAAIAKHEAATKAYEAEYMKLLAKMTRMDIGYDPDLLSNMLGEYTEDDEKQLIAMLR